MQEKRLSSSIVGLCVLGVLAASFPLVAQSSAEEAAAVATALETPKSVRAEHEEIHSALVGATRATGRVGVAANELAEVLHPHFVREEEIALPPLGLLAPLAAKAPVPAADLARAMAMTDSLRAELPRMLEEHKRIHAAIEGLHAAAAAEKATEYERLAEQLALHARTEEEVFYPAAVLVGDIIRARQQGKQTRRDALAGAVRFALPGIRFRGYLARQPDPATLIVEADKEEPT